LDKSHALAALPVGVEAACCRIELSLDASIAILEDTILFPAVDAKIEARLLQWQLHEPWGDAELGLAREPPKVEDGDEDEMFDGKFPCDEAECVPGHQSE